MPLIKEIFNNNEKWIATKLGENDGDYFKKLEKGQEPEILYIGCSDSRVTAEEMTGAQPGMMFVHRNIANMVINTDLSSQSVINYAVVHLQVKHVVVCGHYGCGGVAAAMKQADLGILNPWLREIRDVYRLHADELRQVANEEQRYRRLVEINVQEQCCNVLKTAVVQKAVRTRGLRVHGWVLDMGTGRLQDLKIDFKKILKVIEEIYKLD